MDGHFITRRKSGRQETGVVWTRVNDTCRTNRTSERKMG